MNWVYLHLLINHSVIMFGALGAVAVIVSWFIRRRSVWLYAVATMTLAGASVYPTFASGDEAHDQIHDTPALKPEVSHVTIDEHEESAEVTLWIVLAAGVVSVYAWWRAVKRPEEEPATWLRGLVTLLALAGIVSIVITSELGGVVAHGRNSLTGPPSVLPAPDTGRAAPVHESD